MIRFIIRRKWRDASSGAESDGFETLVCEAPELERVLRGGGCGESGFDIRELAGAEIEQQATQPPAVGVDEMPSLPPLPKPWGTDYDDIDNEEVETFTASQMKAYARAALTAALRTGGGE